MDELLRFLKTYELWIYGLLGVVALVYLRRLILAIIEWRGALFGMEKENAQRRLSEATTVLFLLSLMAVSEFLVVSFVTPTYPGLSPLPTPTIDLFASPSPPVAVDGTPPSPGAAGTPTVRSRNPGCIPGEFEFTSPVQGELISGPVTLRGVVQLADFGFYKYEFRSPGDSDWTTIAAGNQPVIPTPPADPAGDPGADLGVWDTSQLLPGDYELRLVATNHQGEEYPPCALTVRVMAPVE